MLQPDPSYLLEKTGIKYPSIGFYDVPENGSARFKHVPEKLLLSFWQTKKD